MPNVHGLAVHQGAAADDALDAARLALADRGLRHAARPERAVEPHAADATLTRLADDVQGLRRVGGDDDAVDRPRNRPEIRIARGPLDLGCIRVDGIHLVAATAELAVDGIGSLPAISRHARDGDASAFEEAGDRVRVGHHLISRSQRRAAGRRLRTDRAHPLDAVTPETVRAAAAG